MPIPLESLEQIKSKLLAEKKRLESELADFTKRNEHNREDYRAQFPDIGNKDDENAAEVSLYSDNLTLERALERGLKEVNDALKRITLGTYGTCRFCNAFIPLERLLVRPTSASCVKCKEALKKETR